MKRIFTCLLVGTGITAVMSCCGLLMYAIEMVKEGAEHSGDSHLQVNLALLGYHDAHGRFPPAVIRSPDGKPLYSWRVAILPLIDSARLYEEFHQDEPWDSPHNIKLLPKMPPSYAAPGRKADLTK